MVIKNIRTADGVAHASPMAAVEHFKCPGPCDDGLCPLHVATHIGAIGSEKYGYLCHPEIVARSPLAVLDAMKCSYEVHVGDEAPSDRYVAVVKASAVRDMQICAKPECDPFEDDTWLDQPDGEMFLGIFSGPSARGAAAAYAQVCEDNVRLIPIPDPAAGKVEAPDGKS